MDRLILFAAVCLPLASAVLSDPTNEMTWTNTVNLRESPFPWSDSLSGLRMYNVQTGSGEAFQTGETVVVLYKLYKVNGSPMLAFNNPANNAFVYAQSSVDSPFVFQLGSYAVGKGFAEAVGKMLPGGRAVALVPSSLAYGRRGMPSMDIPADTTLLYFIEVVGRA